MFYGVVEIEDTYKEKSAEETSANHGFVLPILWMCEGGGSPFIPSLREDTAYMVGDYVLDEY